MQGIISSVGNIDTGGQGGATDTFVKLTVDLTNVTPTTETINNKQYNKFTFDKNNLTFKTISPFGDEDTISIDDALIYNLLPISNNNTDKGISITYDGTTFTGYVLAQESTLTTESFMFTYYIIIGQTSVTWKNYVDVVACGSEGISLRRKILRTEAHSTVLFPLTFKREFFVDLPQNVQTLADLKNYIINKGACNEYQGTSTTKSYQIAFIPCCYTRKNASSTDLDCGFVLSLKRYSLYSASNVTDNDWESWDGSDIILTIINGTGNVATYTFTITDNWSILEWEG